MTKETYRGIQYNSSDLPLESKVDLKGIYRGVEWKAESAKSETADKGKELSYRGLKHAS
tara:strand:+ start:287 stop:463 length:177 start_codon:yes stop_codon:yes gene_type:complete